MGALMQNRSYERCKTEARVVDVVSLYDYIVGEHIGRADAS